MRTVILFLLISAIFTSQLPQLAFSSDAITRNQALRTCTDRGGSTNDIEVCVAKIEEQESKNLDKYLGFARSRIGDNKVALVKLEASQKDFLAYRKSMCEAVYQHWIQGTIRGTKAACCRLRLLDQRAVSIWEEFIRYQDRTPPPLPRPAGQLCEEE